MRMLTLMHKKKLKICFNKPAAQAAGADPSGCNNS